MYLCFSVLSFLLVIYFLLQFTTILVPQLKRILFKLVAKPTCLIFTKFFFLSKRLYFMLL